MKKVFVNVRTNDAQKAKLESVSKDLQFVYKGENKEFLDSEIIVGNYPADKIKDFKNLRLFQASAIGVDAYIKNGVLNDDVILCNAVDIHSEEVAQHILGMMLSMLKKMYLYRDNQYNCLWNDEGLVKSVKGLRVAIIGYGSIGKHLASILKSLGSYVIGVKRKMIDKPDCLDEIHTMDDLDSVISNVDVVVTVIPGTKENVHIFNVDTFKKMKRDTIFINAGRGNLYSEDVLKEVLDNKLVEAVGMDVFETEPLPADSSLWKYKNLVITPHVAGFFHLESALEDYIELVCENLKRYLNNEELKNVVKERE